MKVSIFYFYFFVIIWTVVVISSFCFILFSLLMLCGN